ncbi:MAG: YdcF family protein [Polaromonas sp.]|nr:YdcF family protein [Polaromonas sp.]
MELSQLKPLLTAMLLPPMGPLLLAFLGLLLALRQKRLGMTLLVLAMVALWLLSCHGVSVGLSRHLLPQIPALKVAELKPRQVQAIVVLGGGVLPLSPEYGEAQLSEDSAARLRYGLHLARQSGLPVAFAGGLGWGAGSQQVAAEADVAGRVAQREHALRLRWTESMSRDTAGNARLLAPLLQREGVKRIALVTHAWHMPRAVQDFTRAGFEVTPAPMGYILPEQWTLLEWLPSTSGLTASRQVLREWLALAVARLNA